MKPGLHPGCSLRVQLRIKERNYRGIEFAMEGRAVKHRRSRQLSGATFANAGVHGARNAK
jgi:hypothetical protein